MNPQPPEILKEIPTDIIFRGQLCTVEPDPISSGLMLRSKQGKVFYCDAKHIEQQEFDFYGCGA